MRRWQVLIHYLLHQRPEFLISHRRHERSSGGGSGCYINYVDNTHDRRIDGRSISTKNLRRCSTFHDYEHTLADPGTHRC